MDWMWGLSVMERKKVDIAETVYVFCVVLRKWMIWKDGKRGGRESLLPYLCRLCAIYELPFTK
jgi:hypothetical protein